MAMGNSGGRSRGNRTGEGARRRNTQRERAYIDPPIDAPEPRFQLTERGRRLVDLAAVSMWLVACVMIALVVCAWFGVV